MPTAVIRLALDRERAEKLAAAAEERLPLGDISIANFEISEGHWTLEIFGPPNMTPAAFETLIQAELGDELAGLKVSAEAIDDADWVSKSLAGLDPVRAGRFMVHGAHDRGKIAANAIGIQVEAALAFGTGHHGTTRGCLLALGDFLQRRMPVNVLDLGTGTGVLAIAAAKALKRPVLATDIDPVSVHITRENAALNGAGHLVRVVEATGFRHAAIRNGAPYDLILANILAAPLVALAPEMAAHVVPGGTIILSGLMASQQRMVIAPYRARGFVPVHRQVLEGWATLVLDYHPPRRWN